MISKIVRVSEEAMQAASSYADDLSTAILVMYARIDEFCGVGADIAPPRRDIPDANNLRKVITGAVNNCFADFSRGY